MKLIGVTFVELLLKVKNKVFDSLRHIVVLININKTRLEITESNAVKMAFRTYRSLEIFLLFGNLGLIIANDNNR